MKIGVIGTGNMGKALGIGWARGGHEVLFGSRNLSKGKAGSEAGAASTRAGDFDEAAAFGDVVLYTVRDVLPSTLLREPSVLAGKIFIDCNNSAILGLDVPDPRDRPGVHFTPPIPSMAERFAADIPGSRVVKAFNTLPSTVLGLSRETLLPHRVSVFVCSDDHEARVVVMRLAEELGFVGVDSGELERAQLVEAVGDFIRFQILAMKLGPFATISVNALPIAESK
jgi:8-hydroxy-5-deazaflavin:NADPH oxidoreductase